MGFAAGAVVGALVGVSRGACFFDSARVFDRDAQFSHFVLMASISSGERGWLVWDLGVLGVLRSFFSAGGASLRATRVGVCLMV